MSMYVILVYDVGVKRNNKVHKIASKYLFPVQNSVFEGYITQKKYQKLKEALGKTIDAELDHIKIYCFDSVAYARAEEIGKAGQPVADII